MVVSLPCRADVALRFPRFSRQSVDQDVVTIRLTFLLIWHVPLKSFSHAKHGLFDADFPQQLGLGDTHECLPDSDQSLCDRDEKQEEDIMSGIECILPQTRKTNFPLIQRKECVAID